ncbi:hypothetical protein QYF36_005210 [Acer negundo]|nr:hypothetical protein QYF36_005210 [Acer negundo]
MSQHESGVAQSNVNSFLQPNHNNVPSGISNKQQLSVPEPQLSRCQIEVGECSSNGISVQEPQLSRSQIKVGDCSSNGISVQEPQINDDELSESYNSYLPLINDAQRGDWKSFVHKHPNVWTSRITSLSQTALHVAAISCQWGFVLKLLEVLPPESITVKDKYGNTALHYVAAGGSLETAEALVQMNPELPQMKDKNGHLPLITSIWTESNKELAWYLSSVTKVDTSNPSNPLLQILRSLIQSGYHGLSALGLASWPVVLFVLPFWLASRKAKQHYNQQDLRLKCFDCSKDYRGKLMRKRHPLYKKLEMPS